MTVSIIRHHNVYKYNLTNHYSVFSVVTLSFEMEQYSTVEGEDVTVCVVLSGQSERNVSVRVSTEDGEAQGKNYRIIVK